MWRESTQHRGIFYGVWIALIFWVLSAFLLGSCNHGPRGIFAELQEEQRIQQANTGENGIPTAIHKIQVGSEDRYYLSAHRLFWRPSNNDGSDWNEIGSPASFENIDSIAVATISSTPYLFASVTNNSNGRSGLFLLNTSNHSWSGELMATTHNTADAPPPEQVVQLLEVEGNGRTRLLIVGRQLNVTDGYTLYSYNTRNSDATDDDSLTVLWPSVGIINDVDRAGASRLLLTDATGLYCVDDDGSAELTETRRIDGSSSLAGMNQFEMRRLVSDSTPDGDAIHLGGIYISETSGSTGDIYVSSGRGALYRYHYTNLGDICSSTWQDGCDNTTDIDDCWGKSNFGIPNYRYTDMLWFASLGRLLIGIRDNNTVEGGYREIEINGSQIGEIHNPQGTSYSSAALSTTSVRSFFVDGGKLFALTEGRGMWRASYDSGVPTWSLDFSR